MKLTKLATTFASSWLLLDGSRQCSSGKTSLRIYHGTADENLPIEACRQYVKRLRRERGA
jgi:hypothetical protein